MFDEMASFLYVMECEGELDTREGKINRAIKMLQSCPNPNDPVTREHIFAKCGLTSLTTNELYRISREVL